ncbi:MAG: hypothetical protein ACK56I_14555, partial [bacterium]
MEKLAVFLQQLGAGQGVRRGQESALYDGRRIMAEPWGWGCICLGRRIPWTGYTQTGQTRTHAVPACQTSLQ